MNERKCPPYYNGGFCADYDADCDACWEQWEQEHKAEWREMAKIESNGSKERMDERLERMHEIECYICDFNIDGVCKLDGQYIPKIGCSGGKAKTMTNADRIRSLSDKELAEWFADMNKSSAFCPNDGEGINCQDDCEKCWLNWLKEKAEKEKE